MGGSAKISAIRAATAAVPRMMRLPSGTVREAGGAARDSIAAMMPPPRLAPSTSTRPSGTGTRPRAASAVTSRIAATLEWNSQVMIAARMKAVTGSPER